MPREILRFVILFFLIYFLISDILELLTYLPSTNLTMAPLLQRMIAGKFRQNNKPKDKKVPPGNGKEILKEKIKNPVPLMTATSSSEARKERILTAEESEQIQQIRERWLKAMQKHCLPKLVCELHASLAGENILNDVEMGILTAIKDTSLGTSGEVVSQYHFAAHMGQLLAGVEGNGCHNFYPECPISGNRVLEVVKKVKVR